MFNDLQEAFYIVMGQFLAKILLPLFVGTGLVAAILMAISRFWRNPIEVKITGWKREE